jgi:hypothetical protein
MRLGAAMVVYHNDSKKERVVQRNCDSIDPSCALFSILTLTGVIELKAK